MTRLGLILGDSDYKGRAREEEEERERDEVILKKIQDMRKLRNKLRIGKSKEQPAAKKIIGWAI